MLNKSYRYAGESPLIILNINVALSFFLRVEGLSQNDRMSEYRERKPTSKGLLARVKCQQRNARTRERDSFSLSQAS